MILDNLELLREVIAVHINCAIGAYNASPGKSDEFFSVIDFTLTDTLQDTCGNIATSYEITIYFVDSETSNMNDLIVVTKNVIADITTRQFTGFKLSNVVVAGLTDYLEAKKVIVVSGVLDSYD